MTKQATKETPIWDLCKHCKGSGKTPRLALLGIASSQPIPPGDTTEVKTRNNDQTFYPSAIKITPEAAASFAVLSLKIGGKEQFKAPGVPMPAGIFSGDLPLLDLSLLEPGAEVSLTVRNISIDGPASFQAIILGSKQAPSD